MGKGGARHTSKPVVDVDLLVTCLAEHKELLADLGSYEQISRNNKGTAEGAALDKRAGDFGVNS